LSAELLDRLKAALADRYTVERELGAGGMATVYLATDLKHERQVAVKVLRPELASALGPERFLREIKTTANLRHPNILPLFDSGEAEGSLFYVMPYLVGESLRDRLRRETQLPLGDALRIADEVADALSYAHDHGVIHRDVKPENVLLEAGHAIVADFGIAHAVTASGDEKLTATGTAIGSPHYMSPEQWSGETVDERSDLYALACMLYEMLAGSPPFTGPTPVAVMAGHAVHPVPSLQAACPSVTGPVAAAVERALAKSPADRFASVKEWRAAVTGPGVEAPAIGAPGVVAAPRAFHKPPPNPSTPLLGREDRLGAAAEQLHAGARVLTITGYGGTGKTRFATELFRRLAADYPSGAGFVSLVSVTSAADVLPTIGTALDIAEAPGRSALDALCTVIGDGRTLLVLDNLEQVLDAAGDIAAVVSRCPGLQVIATSRGPLKIGAESEFVLPPLTLPAEDTTSLDLLRQCPSVALFVQRAEKVNPGFALSTANAETVAAICCRLDGLPLALELAAARVRILEPTSLLQRLDHALDVLTSGDRDLPLRQRTLRATISWSYSLLDAPQQRLLRRVSVFHEGWTLEAMEQVCYTDDDRHRALDELDSLLEKGLVGVVGNGDRYVLLETIRAFAAEQADVGGEVDALRNAHADHFLAFAAGVDVGIKGSGQLAAMRRARADNANMHAAIQWLTVCARTGDSIALEKALQLAGHLNWFWHIGAQHSTARETLDELLALAPADAPSRGRGLALLANAMISTVTGEWDRALRESTGACEDGVAIGDEAIAVEGVFMAGYCHLSVGRMDEARAAVDDAIARAGAGVSEFLQALGMALKGLLLFATGDLEAGLAIVHEARQTQQRLGDYEGSGVALSFLAQMTFAKGDHADAMALYGDALASLETVGDRPEIARVQCELGWTALAASDVPAAQRAFRRAVSTYEEVGSARGTGLALMGLAAVDAAAGRSERAVTIAAAARVLSERAGAVVAHPMDPGVVDRIEALKATIPQATLDDLVASGRTLSPAAVLAMVADT
jgi:predicted ATPase/tRNA A-37 threonylcarbamoyl transferase component Bud32